MHFLQHSGMIAAIAIARNAIRGAVSSLILYPLAQRLEGRKVSGKTAYIRRNLDLPYVERRRQAHLQLAAIVEKAGNTVPYYRDLFAQIKFDPTRLANDLRYLSELPFLTKDIIREQGNRLLSEETEGKQIHSAKTGGSTGPSAVISYDQEAADWASAVIRACRHRIGNPHWRSETHFASRFPDAFPLRDRLRETVKCLTMNRDNIFFDSFDEEELAAIWRDLKRLRPHLVHAHPSTMDQLATYVEHSQGIGHIFAAFESSGELMTNHQREHIARVLECKVINRYGLAEAGVIAYQLDPAKNNMRWLDFNAWPEVLDDTGNLCDRTNGDDAKGELVITPLLNGAMPLLRYRTGDIVTLSEDKNGTFIPEMTGRIHDVICLDGKSLPTHYVQDVLDRVGGIQQFQIEVVENTPIFRIVAEAGADQAAIAHRLTGWWKQEIKVEFIPSSELKLIGHRQKFRHLVASPTPMDSQ